MPETEHIIKWASRIAHVAAIATVALPGYAAIETVLHNFASPPSGAAPRSNVIRDGAGNLYGTTITGGPSNAGVVFKLNTASRETVLYGFTGGVDGGYPYAGVVRDSAGNLYGTCAGGGAADAGVVFKVSPSGHETVLYSFTGGANGNYPNGVILDSAGNLFGTTHSGGAANSGVVFEVNPAGQETVLYSFPGGADGAYPNAGVIRDSAGNLYGTTVSGGKAGPLGTSYGVVYKLDTSGNETVLHTFNGGTDGGNPYAGVIRDPEGNLYGTALGGGAGEVYEVQASGGGRVLYRFSGLSDGNQPYGSLIRDPAGNLYGTTYWGGTGNAGVVFKITAPGQETVLHSFSGADGDHPLDALIQDSEGNLYGTTSAGGVSNEGVIFKLDTAGQESVLYSFPGAADGMSPYAGLTRDSTGNFYGTTPFGGAAGFGVVYKLNTLGRESILYTFTGAADGGNPYGGVILDSAGNLYGTTYLGGSGGYGVVFKLDPSGNETILYSFLGGTDGGSPYAGVVSDSEGNLYGTTEVGGAGSGTVYKIDPSGQETVVYSFADGSINGAYPYAGVVRDSAGNLYGTTSEGGPDNGGVVYKVNPSGQETVLYNFTGGPDGGYPGFFGVILDSVGNLYGSTSGGGMGFGVVFKVTPTGQETVLHSFNGSSDGNGPGGVTLDSAGNLYGTAYSGGSTGAGLVFELDMSGNETVLYDFSGPDGSNPRPSVMLDSAGNLYGTTYEGGRQDSGVVFKIVL
jgi:uncharacterized repeat protein (TIGR03803 family)